MLLNTDIDLNSCATEPIHVPGAIQPHGLLLVIAEPDLTVLQVSANSAAIVGTEPGKLLGTKLSRWLDTAAYSGLTQILSHDDLRPLNPMRLDLKTGHGGEQRRAFDCIMHRVTGKLIVELEPADLGAANTAPGSTGDPPATGEASGVNFFAFYNSVRSSILRLQNVRSFAEACQMSCAEIKRITGFGRVMVYQFDSEWNGDVVAEELDAGFDSYLGLRFPHTDIPSQARRLYTLNWLRLIANVDYEPAPLVPASLAGGQALDLSQSTLRSVSPVHLQYLRNMRVASSMSISLMHGDRLWGLICCHHDGPKYVSYQVRSACEFLGQIFSYQVTAIEAREDFAYRMSRKEHVSQLSAAVAALGMATGLVSSPSALLGLAQASGAAVYSGGRWATVGQTPPVAALQELRTWLEMAPTTEIVATSHLSAEYPGGSDIKATASGLLAAPLAAPGSHVLWFRPEEVQTVRWAGNPEKAVQVTVSSAQAPGDSAAPLAQLHPRRSFAQWKEVVNLRAAPWLKAEIDAVQELRTNILADELGRLNQRLDETNRNLAASNEELDAFTYIASHDLKEPMRGIQTYLSFVFEDDQPNLSASSQEKLRTVASLAQRMDQLLGALYHYSRVGRTELAVGATDLAAVLADVRQRLQNLLTETGTELKAETPLPKVCCDSIRIGEVFYNLIVNAIKYNDKPQRLVAVGCEQKGAGQVFYVRDNGIGIDAKFFPAVFMIFKRLHGKAAYGGGTGTGLTIAKRIVERHGGRIWIESTLGVGTTFYFTLRPEPSTARAVDLLGGIASAGES